MFDYCGVYIGVSTRFSPLFNFDFSLAINRLGKQNVGKIFLSKFFFKRTYSGAFEIATIGPKAYSSAFETVAKAHIKRPIATLLNRHYSLFCFLKIPYSSGLKSTWIRFQNHRDLYQRF